MLQLQTNPINICRISKLLVRYNVKASITDSVITFGGDVSDELLTRLCEDIDINSIQNFASHVAFNENKENRSSKSEERTLGMSMKDPEKVKIPEFLPHKYLEYDLIYSEVKRGEVYWCDFGDPHGSEQGGYRPAIVIQNDDGNLHSPTTIVIACTTEHKKRLPVHFHCKFSSQNIIDYDPLRVSSEENVIMAEQIQTVDKTRLRKYIGTLTPEFMKIIESKIDVSLHLIRQVKTIVKQENVYVDRAIHKETVVTPETTKERKDVNMVQVQLLSFVDINQLLKISQSYALDEIKAQRILELFGFDFKKNGVQYLLRAIVNSPKDAYFNLETLAESISEKESIDKEEIKRLIVARIKERFSFKKAPTIDFIRLVNNFLSK